MNEAIRKRIVLIHAVTVAIEPIQSAFAESWPEAEIVNLLDDSLSPDRAKAETLSPALSERIVELGAYAGKLGADGVLYTCSAFGEAIEIAARKSSWPVLKPNEAMFDAALARGGRIGMLATFLPSVASMEREFDEMRAIRGVAAELRTVCVPEAMVALKQGDALRHNAMLAEAVSQLGRVDTILLAHFSTSRAHAAVAAATTASVLTSPGSAVTRLKSILSPNAA
jgi:hypothetical protein